jgi:hypothetical protein
MSSSISKIDILQSALNTARETIFRDALNEARACEARAKALRAAVAQESLADVVWATDGVLKGRAEAVAQALQLINSFSREE